MYSAAVKYTTTTVVVTLNKELKDFCCCSKKHCSPYSCYPKQPRDHPFCTQCPVGRTLLLLRVAGILSRHLFFCSGAVGVRFNSPRPERSRTGGKGLTDRARRSLFYRCGFASGVSRVSYCICYSYGSPPYGGLFQVIKWGFLSFFSVLTGVQFRLRGGGPRKPAGYRLLAEAGQREGECAALVGGALHLDMSALAFDE